MINRQERSEMNIFNYVKSSVPMIDIMYDYVADLKKVESVYKGVCPFQECAIKVDFDHVDGFTVNPDKEIFYCFYCHKSGDITSFIQEIKHITPNQAVLFIIEKYILKMTEEVSRQP